MTTASTPAISIPAAAQQALAARGATGVPALGKGSASPARMKATAEQFEQVYVSAMLSQMFAGVQGEGPMGVNGPGGDTWRSFLTDQYAKQITRSGGLGIARQVMHELIRLQEGNK